MLALADRIVVMAEGRTVGELPGDGATEEQVLRLATRYTASVAERAQGSSWRRHDDDTGHPTEAENAEHGREALLVRIVRRLGRIRAS